MSLVVLGGHDLDTLQAWVQDSFGDIPTGTAGPAASFEGQGLPFQVGFCNG
jgi:secreted Zn-dependent insulinase-like peptidase